MCFRTESPERDFDRWDAEQADALALLPVCCECGEPIQDDFCYQINDEIICEECLNHSFRKVTTDLMG